MQHAGQRHFLLIAAGQRFDGVFGRRRFISNRCIHSATACRRCFRFSQPQRLYGRSRLYVMLSAIERASASPSRLRSSET